MKKKVKENQVESQSRQITTTIKIAENSEKLFKKLKVDDQIVLKVN